MNILFVSHCDFGGNSAMHIFNAANALTQFQIASAISVPNEPATVRQHGTRRFQVLHHNATVRDGVVFPDGKGPDLVHAWTPREEVRKVTMSAVERYGCPYLVHLEDHEDEIVADDFPQFPFHELSRLPVPLLDQIVVPWRSHPRRWKEFIAGASGVTALIDRLLEFKPAHLPGTVFWPGYETEFLAGSADPARLRESLGLREEDRVLVYNGNIHASNEKDVTDLILAAVILNRSGIPVKLLKTGQNYAAHEVLEQAIRSGCAMDLGFVARAQVAPLLQLADVLVQPGRPSKFNDYRFPSKLPEFLAARKPVVLPHSNLGRYLRDGVECLLLERGDAGEIAEKVKRILLDPELAERLAGAGQRFALEHLNWANNVAAIHDLYRTILQSDRPAAALPQPSELPPDPVKLIAFYLPQFHPIPENDEWWGEGFTEWTNVIRGQPMYPGHDQPQLPAELGFYDLRSPEVMEKQAALAREYGVFGFCLYYYWFDGHKLLDLPLRHMLESGKPDFPFCLCWANENWTRNWDGRHDQILMKQHYSPDGDQRFIEELIPIFSDRRYIRIEGAPLLLVYRADDLPDAAATARRWREICASHGIPKIHLAAVQGLLMKDPRPFGFDSAVEFPPHVQRALVPAGLLPSVSPEFKGFMEDSPTIVRNQLAEPPVPYVRYRGVMPAWDNTARRGSHAHINIRTSPALYEQWLSGMVEQTMHLQHVQEPLVFINAWNEWAEGTHLEPDRRYGRGYLEANRLGLWKGIARYCNERGLAISEAAVQQAVAQQGGTGEKLPARHYRTEARIDANELARIRRHYEGRFQPAPLSYATVRDYCDSFDHIRALAAANGDLKDVQRPWMLKAILGKVKRGGRLLEIGAGEPIVADLLSRLGYEVWIVDPYDGSGHGPTDLARFSAECPDIRFIHSEFHDDLLEAPEQAFDCIYSISVLEHVPAAGILGAARGMRKYLKPDGVTIHAIDHAHRGAGAQEHLAGLELMTAQFGFAASELKDTLRTMESDTDTYYLSAESHNRWRGTVPYESFPMRTCVSVQLIGGAPGGDS